MSSGSRSFGVLGLLLAFALGVSACNQGNSEPESADSGTPAISAGSVENEKREDTAQPNDLVRPVQEDVRGDHQAPTAQPPAPSRPAASSSPSAAESKVTRAPSEPAARAPELQDIGSPPEPPPAPPAPPAMLEPEIIEVTVPAGSVLELELLTALDTSVNRVGDEIQARTISPLYVKGKPVLAQGSYVEGRVTAVQASGKVKGKASIGFTFDRLSTHTGVKEIRTTFVEKEAASRKKKDAAVIGGAAGAGALIGAILGGKKGAAIGAGIGGAGGTGVVLTTKGEEIRIPVGSEINVRLDEELVLQLN